MNTDEREAARVVQEVAARAIRRLDILEWVILAGAVAFAFAGGAALAWLVHEPMGVGFRPVWAVASFLFFVVPGAIALIRLRRDERKRMLQANRPDREDDGRR